MNIPLYIHTKEVGLFGCGKYSHLAKVPFALGLRRSIEITLRPFQCAGSRLMSSRRAWKALPL